MKKKLITIVFLLMLFSCSQNKYNYRSNTVNFDAVLSDTLIKNYFLNENDIVEFIVQNGEKECKKKFHLLYFKKEIEDTLWYILSTMSITGDTIIDLLKFDQEEQILDRIYYNNLKSNSENICVDFLKKNTYEKGIYYDVELFEIDCNGKFTFIDSESQFERDLTMLTKDKKFCGIYETNNKNIFAHLELKDGKIDDTYAMRFVIQDNNGCVQVYTQPNLLIESNKFILGDNKMTVEIFKNSADLYIRRLEICDTIEKLELNLTKLDYHK